MLAGTKTDVLNSSKGNGSGSSARSRYLLNVGVDANVTDMSTAYFIVLDHDEPGFDAFVDGKMLTKHLDEVNKAAREKGLKQFEDYAFQDLSEFGGPDLEPEWFDASEGVQWASSILAFIQENPNFVGDPEAVVLDLQDYVRVFREAAARGFRWHLELDF